MPTDVLIAGDVYPTASVGDLARRLGLEVPPDLFVWTLDAAVPAGPPRPGVTCLGFEPDNLDALKLGRTNVAVTAANHLTDFSDAGVVATLDALAARGFQHVGAGANRAAAERNLIIDLPEGRVAILAYAEIHARVGAVAAGGASAGVRALERESSLEAIRAARHAADWVWVVLHWGEEFVRYPDPEQRRLAREMVDAGASLVVASHTHVPLGFERRGAAAIFYGLGNFLFPPYREASGFQYRWHPASRQGVVAAGRLSGGKWTWQPREIRLCRSGLPSFRPHGHCPDYGQLLADAAADYERQYPALRRGERIKFRLGRLWHMSWGERAVRIRRLLKAEHSRQKAES